RGPEDDPVRGRHVYKQERCCVYGEYRKARRYPERQEGVYYSFGRVLALRDLPYAVHIRAEIDREPEIQRYGLRERKQAEIGNPEGPRQVNVGYEERAPSDGLAYDGPSEVGREPAGYGFRVSVARGLFEPERGHLSVPATSLFQAPASPSR